MEKTGGVDSNQIHASMTALMSEATKYLSLYLEKLLPSLFDDWWKQAVVNNLSFQQRQRMDQRSINSLASLDLSALLRVLDQNWYQISLKLNLTPEARHFVKEMQTVRNRWAHAGTEGFPVEDVYRDLDTLQRFASVIEADEDLLQEVRARKASLLAREMPFSAQGETVEQKPTQNTKDHRTDFEPGQIVTLKSNPAIRGAVVSVLVGKPENRFKVFVNGEKQTYYASQLQAEDRQDEDLEFLLCDQFHSYLSALQILYPGLSTKVKDQMAAALAGVRTLDLMRLLPGPFYTMLLDGFGADVIKVEGPHRGDYIR